MEIIISVSLSQFLKPVWKQTLFFCCILCCYIWLKITCLICKTIQKYFLYFCSIYIHPYKPCFSVIHISAHKVYTFERKKKKAKNNKQRNVMSQQIHNLMKCLLPHTDSIVDLHSTSPPPCFLSY